ncbi:hypothetical protein D6158_36720, partial [Nocardia seriolae]
LGPFPMYRAFPGSEYYDPSAPSTPQQPTMSLPIDHSLDASRDGRDGMVPTFTDIHSEQEAAGFVPAVSSRLHRRNSP